VNRIGGGKLLGPKGLAVNAAGNLVVVDNKASCVYIFQLNGKLLSKFGSRGSEGPKFAGPHYVAVNSLGHIIVSDFHNHSIKVCMTSCRLFANYYYSPWRNCYLLPNYRLMQDAFPQFSACWTFALNFQLFECIQSYAMQKFPAIACVVGFYILTR
jgi:DNA-binding beta-propeller fold protein YncE